MTSVIDVRKQTNQLNEEKPMSAFDLDSLRFGKRAEILAEWYLRFNGYFPLPNFILHDAGLERQKGEQLTEADVLAVHLPHTREIIRGKGYEFEVEPHRDLNVKRGLMDFVIVEVSSEECKLNWLQEDDTINREFLKYILRRFGWWKEDTVSSISRTLSTEKYWESDEESNRGTKERIRVLSIGPSRSADSLEGLIEITFVDILDFLKYELFMSYTRSEDIGIIVSNHQQWHPLICKIYNMLLGHRGEEKESEEVVKWLFPDSQL
jgi:hypothetical protein